MKRSLLLSLLVASLTTTWFARGDDPSSKKIVEALQPFVDKKALAGAVTVVADKDKILSVDAVGFSDIENSKMMGPSAVFWIASQSKPITAAGLMLLVDDGKVNLDDPIEKYLPEFRNVWVAVESDKEHLLLKHPKRKITVRDVLSHVSGMPFQSDMERPTLDGLSLKDAVRSYSITPLVAEPGTKYLYSNCGINVAGRIIEVVSGMPYEEFMEKRLFAPLGMKETTFWPTAEQLTRLAKPYSSAANGLVETKIAQLQYPLDARKRHVMPAGGYFSTAGDVTRFCQMALGGGEFQGKRLISEASVKEMTKRQTPESMKESYGLGWAISPDGFGHAGALGTNMTIDAKRGLITVFLVQGAKGTSDAAFRKTALETFAK